MEWKKLDRQENIKFNLKKLRKEAGQAECIWVMEIEMIDNRFKDFKES
jgi:hypothetical protein